MALEAPSVPIASPEDELAFLRAQVEAKEKELQGLKQEQPRVLVAHERIIHHRQNADEVLSPAYRISEEHATALALNLDPENDDETMEELRGIMEEKGIRNAFAVLEKLNSPHLEDDFHRFLVQYLVAGMKVKEFAENQPAWKALHLTLYEIALPEPTGAGTESRAKTLKELISAMEQFYSGMMSVGEAYAGEPAYFSLELAVPVDRSHLQFYASVPNGRCDLFEKQLLAIFPDAHITAQPNDYNVFVEDGYSYGSTARLSSRGMLPLKDYEDFDYDPINSILNAFAKIGADSEGAALQIIIQPQGDRYMKHYRRVLDELRRGETVSRALSLPESLAGEFVREAGTLFGKQKELHREDADQQVIELVEKKMSSPIVSTNIRLVVSSQSPTHATQILNELESAFNQFENTRSNRLVFKRAAKGGARELFHNFTFRLFSHGAEMPLSLRELTTIYHFPPQGIESSPHLKQARHTTAPPPLELGRNRISLGTNLYRGLSTALKL
ncbi:MAG: hypothetical protein P4M11_10480, partial [Candidatus Pacebacteria bacterium]|nr:hypothetical protein [Candidatus Paceibacterota bacterium]